MKAFKKLIVGGGPAKPSKTSEAPAGVAVGYIPAKPAFVAAAAPAKPAGVLPSVPISAAPVACTNGCGWTAFPGHPTCCRSCKGSEGPHSKDCATKNKLLRPLCFCGCGRPAFGSFATCCTKCEGPDGPHTKDCAAKNLKTGIDARTSAGSSASDASVITGVVVGVVTGGAAGCTAAKAAPKSPEEVNEELRMRLVEWHAAGAMQTRAQVDEVIGTLAMSSGMEPEAVRMLWLTVARQARPVGAPVELYIALAKQHHDVDVEVIDLGAGSARHTNSCMFLTCAAALADRRFHGYEDAIPPGVLGDALADASPDGNAMASIDELIEQHRRHRAGTLCRMADALRHAACEILMYDAEFFCPFFQPVGRRASPMAAFSEADSKKAYYDWVQKLRGDEEGDELVILALARLIGMAVQPVQQSGYRVPLMDPTGAAETGCISYWGNDDKHWVWLRTTSDGAPRETASPAVTAAEDRASMEPPASSEYIDLF